MNTPADFVLTVGSKGGSKGGKDGGKGKGASKGGKDGGKSKGKGSKGGKDGGKGKGKGGRGGKGGAKGGAKVVVEPHRHEGVFIAKGKEDALVTRNLVPGESVYGEKRISIDVSFHIFSIYYLDQAFE